MKGPVNGHHTRRLPMPERFWARVDATGGPDACWQWLANRERDGYGNFRLDNQQQKAHRVAWTLAIGRIPHGLIVLHRCDNPACVNPAHLSLGTQADNVADRSAKGRSASGDRHGTRTKPHRVARGERAAQAKLTPDDVWAIRHCMLKHRLFTRAEIARDYGVSQVAIGKIANNENWKHITESWPF